MVGNIHEMVIDSKGRITLSKETRQYLGLLPGMKIRINIEGDHIVIEKAITPEEFITTMNGFVKKGSELPVTDPLDLKHIWLQIEGIMGLAIMKPYSG